MAGQTCLVLGGVRSGKSAFAEELVRPRNEPTLYLATGQASDAEMQERIRRHQERRPSNWQTREEPLAIADALAESLQAEKHPSVVLVDSLDGWVSNLLLAHEAETDSALESMAFDAVKQLVQVCADAASDLYLVSSEVGLSLVPPYPLGRRFQDLLGLVNQQAAAAAQEVYLIVAGVPVVVKK